MQRCNYHLVATLAVYSMLHADVTAQFITFKDGKFGVNFGGYEASAGLGGLLTGNSAHGGLSASAGTPWGPRAAAGLGGSLDGAAKGVAYAGAEASPAVGASAGLGGSAGDEGYAGAEAHVNNKVKAKTITSGYVSKPVPALVPPPATEEVHESDNDGIQKIKPDKKKHKLFKTKRQRVEIHDEVTHSAAVPPTPPPPAAPAAHYAPTIYAEKNIQSNVVHSALNIPIGILRSLQESLSGLQVSGYKRVQAQYKL